MYRRTALITAASIVAVVMTGATAVGANIGILSSADESAIGNLTAVSAVAVESPAAVDPPSAPTVEPSPDDGVTFQEFEADVAGRLGIEFTSTQLRLGSVFPNSGWTWESEQSSDTALEVTFISRETKMEFSATLGPDGTITAKVDQPITRTVEGAPEVITVPAPATTTPSTSGAAVAASTSPTVAAVVVPASSTAAVTGQPTATAVVQPRSTASHESEDEREGEREEDHPEDDHQEDESQEDDHREDESREDESQEDEHEEYEGGEDDD